MLSKDLSSGLITTSQINAKAQAYFAALYTNTDAQSVSISATYTASNGSMGSTIQVNGSGIDHHRFHEGRRLPEPQFQHQFDLRMGQRADARGDGARQYRIDGRQRQDVRAAELRAEAT